MDRPLTLTKEHLEAILQATYDHTYHLSGVRPYDGQVTVDDVKSINNELAAARIEGPCVIVDISDPMGMHPGHLASTLNGYGNNLDTIAEEAEKTRKAIENLNTDLSNKLDSIANGANAVYVTLNEIRDAIRALGNAAILAQPLPPEDADLDAAAARILEALDRRPDLLAVVRDKLRGS